MRPLRYLVFGAVLALAACNQEQPREAEGSAPPIETPSEDVAPQRAELPPVDAALLGAPNSAFSAIEPSEVGVFGAPAVLEALVPLLGPEVVEGSEVSLSVRENGDDAVADIVRTGLQDDSVAGGHVRIEFRREADGWFPVNAYRRTQCARGGQEGEWTSGLCP
jgi:hypothetical protein